MNEDDKKNQGEKEAMIFEEISSIIDRKKIELSNYEDKIRETGEILQGLEELRGIYNSECEKLSKIKEEFEFLNSEKNQLERDNQNLQTTKLQLKTYIENMEAKASRVKEDIYFKGKELDLLRQEIENVNHELMLNNENSKKMIKEIGQFEVQTEKIKSETQHFRVEFEKLKEEKNGIVDKIEVKKKEYENLNKSILEREKEIYEHEMIIGSLIKQTQAVNMNREEVISELKEKKMKISEMHNEFLKLEKELGSQYAKVDIVKSSLSEIENDINKKKSELYQINKDIEEKSFDKKKITDSIQVDIAKQNRLNHENNRLKVVKESYETSIHDLVVSFEKLSNDERVKKMELENLESKKKDKEREFAVIEERMNMLNKQLSGLISDRDEQVNKLNKITEEYNRTSSILEDKEKQIEDSYSRLKDVHQKILENETELVNLSEKVNFEKDSVSKIAEHRKLKEQELNKIKNNCLNIESKVAFLNESERKQKIILDALEEDKKQKILDIQRVQDDLNRLIHEKGELEKSVEGERFRLNELIDENKNYERRIKDKEIYLINQDKEIERGYTRFYKENIRVNKIIDEVNILSNKKIAAMNELAVIKSNIELYRGEYEKVALKLSDLKNNKNKLVAENFVKEVKDVYYLRKDNEELRVKLKNVLEGNFNEYKKAIKNE